MTLGDEKDATSDPGSRVTLDDMFRRAAARRPNALALIDPPDRETVMGDPPRALTYAETDRLVSAIAWRLRQLDMPVDAIVGLQLPNTVESVLTLLGILRAGMVAAPLPLLWRREECTAALGRLGARALISCRRIGETDFSALARDIAAETFSIRQVCGFGRDLPEGIVALDDIFLPAAIESAPPLAREGNPASHVAVVTWDVTADGLAPVARNHSELLAGGRAAVLESLLPQDSVILSCLLGQSFAGMALSVSQWLLTGGTLALHHPFNPDVFATQCDELGCDLMVLPGPIIQQLGATRLATRNGRLKTMVAVWRAPERLPASPVWNDPDVSLVDVQVFGETGLIATRRGLDGRAAPLRPGVITVPRDTRNGAAVGELMRTEFGTLALRGAMVPHHPFPRHAAQGSAPYLRVGEDGFVDTGYRCNEDYETRSLTVTGAPAGLVSVGGYRFPLRNVRELIATIDQDATLAALPDALAGHRLAGNASDNPALRNALEERGVNPLLVRAFRDRTETAPPEPDSNA